MKSTNASKDRPILVVVGPTGVGKTELSLWLAEKLSAEIISADSRQVYRHMDIGTAKPSADELVRVRHHFISIKNPDEYYSAGEYGREARDCIDLLFNSGKQSLIVGGSGFYLRALIDGLFAPRISSQRIKQKIRERIRFEGADQVFESLQVIDPKTARRLHPNDVQRVVRALEVYEITGIPISEFQSGQEQPARFKPVMIGLERARQQLYRRIEQRVDHMIEKGLVDEVRGLLSMGYGPELNSLRTVGYQEVFEYLDGRLDYDTMVEQIKIHSRQYAKRQLTWFRRDKRIKWVDVGNVDHERILANLFQQLS